MSIYKQKGRRTWQVVVIADEHGRKLEGASTGCASKRAAEDVDRFVAAKVHAREWGIVNAIVAKRTTLARAYDTFRAGGDAALDALVAKLEAAERVPDADALVTAWAGEGANPRYVTAVRRLIPAGRRFPLTEFRRGRIAEFLRTLTTDIRRNPGHRHEGALASGATRNRYKAALNDFAKWCVEREVLEHNPVRDVTSFPESDPCDVFLTDAQGQALVRALPDMEARALAALLANGIEWGALHNAVRRDLDLAATPFPTVHLFPGVRPEGEGRKGKNRHRTNRVVELTEPWTHAYVRAWLAGLSPAAHVVQQYRHSRGQPDLLRVVHDRTAKALKLPPTKLHAWRHTYIEVAKQRGDPEQRIKLQVGHAANSPLLHTRYGVRRYQREQTPAAPEPRPDEVPHG